MKTPHFWQSKNIFSLALLPLAAMYGAISGIKRRMSKPKSVGIPVICIGNLTAGGAGKTPVALAIGEWFKAKNINAFYLTRGYGGRLKKPALVQPSHTARDVGDEALLLAKILPTIVAKNRVQGAKLAVEMGARAILMDDGFQNQSLAKTVSFLVIDGTTGFGNGRLLPAGPLRELPETGLSRTSAIIVINPSSVPQSFPKYLPVIHARTYPEKAGHALRGRKVFAFCGIGYPQKFFDTLLLLGCVIEGTAIFADHHPYSTREIRKLAAAADRKKALLVTTAKDAVRLSPELASEVTVVAIALEFDKPEVMEGLLRKALA